MSPPKTLLQLAGAPSAPSSFAAATIVMIDCQREYVDGVLALPEVAPALAECAHLLTRARAAGAPVIHVAHHGRPGGGLFDPEGPSGEIAPEAAPSEGEAMVVKSLPNAFARTDLQDRLAAIGRQELILAGFMTHMCISSTTRAALDLGYRCTVVDAACATRDLPDGQGGVLAAGDLHRASLVALSDRFAVIAPNADAIPAH